MGLFNAFRSMGPRLQQQGYSSPWTYLRDIAQQQSPQQFSGYPPGYGLPPTPIPGYSPSYVTGGVKPLYPATASRPEGPRYSSEQLAEIQRLQNTPGATAPKIGILSYPGMASASAPGMASTSASRFGTGVAQSNWDNRRRIKAQLDQMRGRMNVQYDPSQFSGQLNDYLNNRLVGWGGMNPESRNMFLSRLGGFGELESARRAASPEYAQLSQQYASAPRGVIR